MLRFLRPLRLLALATALAGCASTPVRPFSPPPHRVRTADLLNYDIALTIDHEARYVRGEVAVRFAALEQPLRQLVLDAVALDIERVLDAEGRELPFETDADTLTIHLLEALQPGQTTEVSIAYDAFPRRGLYFVAPSSSDPDRPWQIWSQGETHETRHWLPVWDQLSDRATHTLALTVDDHFITLAAGELIESVPRPARGTRTDIWSMTTPHPAYLITLVAGELGRSELPDGPVPLPLVARQRDLAAAAQGTRKTADMLRFIGSFTGRDYPYTKYAQTFVDEFTAGGMENISATTMYDEGLHAPSDEPQMDITGLVVHELAHQWFGDLLSCNDWAHLWINEGWADYVELIYHGEQHGRAAEEAVALQYQRAGCQAELDSSRPVVWTGYSDPDETFDDHNYNGAAARIRLLADQLGPETFGRAVQAWVSWAAGRQVDTDDLQRVFSESSGQDLSRFFDEWFRGRGYPRFEVSTAPGPVLVARQVQGREGWRGVFHVTLEARWSRGGVEHSARVPCGQLETRIELQGDGPLDWFCFDSAHVLPGEVRAQQDIQAWTAQLLGAKDSVIRLLAAQWFDGDPWVAAEPLPDEYGPAVLAALTSAANGDPFIDVRLAALSALSSDDSAETAQLLGRMAEDLEPQLRELAMGLLAEHVPTHRDLLPLLRAGLSDQSTAVMVAAATGLQALDDPGLLATLERLIDDHDAVRLDRNLVELAASLDDPGRIPFLIGVARSHPERWVRAAAVAGLGEAHETGPHGEAVFLQLCESLQDASYDVRAAAARSLADSDDPRASRQLRARWDLEVDPTVLTALESALASASDSASEVAD